MNRKSGIICPKLLRTLIVGDDPSLVAQLCSAIAIKRCYLPVVDEPRIHRPDADNEYVRRHNVAARMQAKHVIYANVSDDIIKSIALPDQMVIKIINFSEIFRHRSKLNLHDEKYLDWGKDNIAIGLLTALRARKILRIVPDGRNSSEIATKSGHLVICEDHNELSTVQAANYAYSLDAGLKVIPTISDQDRQMLLERFYSVNTHNGDALSPTQRLSDLATEIREFVGEDLPKEVEFLTFITSGIPWGFGYPKIPSTHLFTYPDLGIHLVNAFAAEQRGQPGIRVATVIEPGKVNAAEVDVVIESLCERNSLVREYQGEHATVRNVSEAIYQYPYDLLFISSHCGDSEGWQWTYKFKDSSGKDRELVVDVAAGFAPEPGEDSIAVTMQQSFVSLDGIPWNDPERDKKLVVGSALNDWTELTQNGGLEPIHKKSIPRVHGSSAIALYDHQLILMPIEFASHNTPIVINNACLSWHKLASTFTFMNSRLYLGTLFEVSDGEAFEIVSLLFTKYFNRPLPIALWLAQNKVYGDSVRRPYVMTGPHFQRLRTVPGNKVQYLEQVLSRLKNNYNVRQKAGQIPKRFGKDIEKHIEFLDYEIDALRNRRTDVSNRPSSARTYNQSRLIVE